MVAEDRWALHQDRIDRKTSLWKDIRFPLRVQLRKARLLGRQHIVQVLVLSMLAVGAFAQPGEVAVLLPGQNFGVLGEYFLDNPNTCGGNGSFSIFDHLVPNLTRKERKIFQPSRLGFDIKRCTWQKNVFGDLKEVCAGSDVVTQNFAARWSGYLYVITGGLYEFELEVDDGARLTIGHGQCPGISCFDFVDTMNVDMRHQAMFETSSQGRAAGTPIYTYAKQCPLCATGQFGGCFMTTNGCEPFSAWTLEADGATKERPQTCNRVAAPQKFRGSKYLQAGQHPFKLEYFQRGGDARVILRWKGPDSGNTMSVVNDFAFVYPNYAGFKAQWFEMPEPAQGDTDIRLARYVSIMGDIYDGRYLRYKEYGLQDLKPQQTSAADLARLTYARMSFSDQIQLQTRITVVRFTAWLRISNAGLYEFKLKSDDGSRLVLGGQGLRREKVIVDNDGKKERLLETIGAETLYSGYHSIRLEYLYIPGKLGILPSPPGLLFQFKGPDTEGAWQDVHSPPTPNPFRANNADCGITSWSWSEGSLSTSDCLGECFETRPGFVGDGKCDLGQQSAIPVLDLQCPQWNFDNNDCKYETAPIITTRIPGINCYSTCPTGKWKRYDCSQCTGQVQNDACVYNQERAPDCIPTADNPDKCNFRQCCTAKLENIAGWGADCIQFGTATNCTDTLKQIITNRRLVAAPLYEEALYLDLNDPPPRIPVNGYVLSEEINPLLNTITQDYVKNPYTGYPTTEKVCPVGEAPDGIQCYDGPWELTGLQEPLKECQGGVFEDNFCVNKKTVTGLPFTTCCTLAWMNAKGGQECRFVGIPFSNCADYVKAYQISVATNSFTAISAPLVIYQCSGDKCNSPRPDLQTGLENIGCPSVINTEPWQTNLLRTRAPGDPIPDELLYGNAKPKEAEKFDPTLVICIGAGVLALAIGACVTYYALQRPPPSPWHSEKAVVVAHDTWIEPEMDQNTGKEYGVVAPRTFAFLSAQAAEKPKIIPKALRINPCEFAVPEEAVEGAIQKQLRFEDDVANCRIHQFLPEEELRQAALEDVKKSHTSHLQQQLEDRQAVPAELRDHSVPHLPQVVHMPDPFKDRSWALKDEEDEVEGADEDADEGQDPSHRDRLYSKVSKASSKDRRNSSKTPIEWRRGSAILKAPISFALADATDDVESSTQDSAPESTGIDPRLEEQGFTKAAVTSRPPAAARYERKGKGKGSVGFRCT